MIAFAMNDSRFGFFRQVLKDISQCFYQAIVERISLGGSAKAHHSHRAFHFKVDAI